MEWSKLSGQLSSAARVTYGSGNTEAILIIDPVSYADSGRYKCVALAEGRAVAEGFADIQIMGKGNMWFMGI